MALSATQIQKLIEDDGYPAFFEQYETQQPLYPVLCDVVDVSQAGAPEYGDKGSTFQNVDRFVEREDGAEVEDSTLNEAHTWQIKIRTYSRRIRIPERIIANNDTSAARALLTQAASGWGRLAPLQKDDFVAQLFQEGVLTAGSEDYFDNSYLQNSDANKGFIYDGLPWFDTAHALSDGSGSYANHTASLALSQANLETVMQTMTGANAVDDRGERVIINPTHLIVPSGLQFDAQRILRTAMATGGNDNDINPLFNQLVPVTWRALSDTASSASWWVVQAGMGLRAYDSPVKMRQYQERNGDISIIAQYRFGAGVTNWRFGYCANKAAS